MPVRARGRAARRAAVAARGRGFTYVAVLGLVAATAAATTWLQPVWATAAQRERELELLAIGAEFRSAIASYVAADPRRTFPRQLEDLVLDPRHTAVRRHLRRIYADPMTGAATWGLVRAPDGGIAGVHSLSQKQPFKRSGFAPTEAAFVQADRYSDWRFVYRDAAPAAPGQRAAPGARKPSGPEQFTAAGPPAQQPLPQNSPP